MATRMGTQGRRLTALTAMALTATALAASLAGCGFGWDRCADEPQAVALVGADVARGKAAIGRYGCGSCHHIPGIVGAVAYVGPPLDGLSQRAYVAGVLPNTPNNLVTWIVNPQAVDNKTAMPYLGVTPGEARDIATYLYTLH